MENVEKILLKNNFPPIYHKLYFMLSPLPPLFPYWHKNRIFVLTELICSCFHMGPQAPHLWKDPWEQKNYWVSSTCSPQREEISGLTEVWTVNIVVPKDPWRTWTQSPAQSAQFPAIAFLLYCLLGFLSPSISWASSGDVLYGLLCCSSAASLFSKSERHTWGWQFPPTNFVGEKGYSSMLPLPSLTASFITNWYSSEISPLLL